LEILRFATAGSVDDGKSTLIGRLLYDTKAIFEDQLESVEQTSKARGYDYVNLALLTDGLRAEREQGITIDVAYRYFSTPKRKFIIADTPGHIQHTRNMVTGCSNVDLVLLILDARNKVVEQTRRHAIIASLLGIKHMVLCVNKMDLVDYSMDIYEEIKDEFFDFAKRLEIPDITVIPISALKGENIVERSLLMTWYEGPSLLHYLEDLYISSDTNLIDVRFPVQLVIRPVADDKFRDFRGYAGTLVSGEIAVGDEIVVLPSGFNARIISINGPQGGVERAVAPSSLVLELDQDLDIVRGDMICRPHNRPHISQDLSAMICWLSDKPMKPKGKYLLKHCNRYVKAVLENLHYELNVNTLHRNPNAEYLSLNQIGRIDLRTASALFYDSYKKNRPTGSFILIDESTNDTVAAGMLLEHQI
jgi:bifunctional enzyme CysN/CysC